MGRKGLVLARAGTHSRGWAEPPLPAMLHVGNRPIICHVVDALEAAGVDETFVVGVPHLLDGLRATIKQDASCSGQIRFVSCESEDDPFAMAAPVSSLIGEASCIVHAADGLVDQPLAPLVELLRPQHPDVVLLLHDGGRRRERLDQEALQVLRISEITGFRSPNALAGACLLGEGVLELVVSEAHDSPCAPMLVSLADRVTSKGGVVQAGRVSWHRYTGDPRELLALNRTVLDKLPMRTHPPDLGENQIEGRVLIHPSAQVRSSVIIGPAIIGARARVEDAYIGPYTSIGSDAEVEGAEISRSILLEGARVTHVRERIEATTIGPGAWVHGDFALPRALRMHVGEGAEVVLS